MTCGHSPRAHLFWHPTCAYRVHSKGLEMMLTSSVVEAGFERRIGRSVSLDHAAELLGVSRRTIYNRIRDGRLQTIRTLGGSQRVLLESVQDGRGFRADVPVRIHAV
jgi:excisionase family DNA binding protein